MDRDSWEELGHGDVKKSDLVIWVTLLINKINVLRLENRQVGMLKTEAKFRDHPPSPPQPVYILFHDFIRSLVLKMQMRLLYILPVLVEQVVSQQLGWDYTK